MTFIEQLLNGENVEWKKLGEVITIEKGKQLNKSLLTESGEYPAYNGGVTFSGFTDKYNYETSAKLSLPLINSLITTLNLKIKPI